MTETIASIAVDIATFISLMVAAYVAIQSLKRANVKIDTIEKKIIHIDHAVNGVEPGDATIRENVQDMHDSEFPEKIPPLVRQIVALLKSEAKKEEQPLLPNGDGE